MSDKYIPKLDSWYLDISTCQDTYPSALSIKEVPFSNRNVIQNLGMKTRRTHVECSFQEVPAITNGWSTSIAMYPTYNEHYNFIEKIKHSLTPLTFVHPKYGEIQGHVENLTVIHDDTQQFAAITFDFVQELTEDVVTYTKFVVPETAQTWIGTNTETTAKIEESQKSSLNLTSWQGAASKYMGKLDAWKNDVTSLPNSIINTVDYATDLPGQMMSSINSAIDRTVQAFESVRNFPASFINNIIAGIRELKSNFSGTEAQYVHVMGASRVAYEAAGIYQTDDENRVEVEKKENVETFDADGNYLGTPTFQEVMTIDELEKTIYDIKELIDEAIQLDRENQDLKDSARILQDYVNDVKLGRQRILQLENVPLMSLHTLVTQYGLSYQAAERILKLNTNIQNPNFVSGFVNILV